MRYLKVTFLCATASSLIVLGLCEFDAFRRADAALFALLGAPPPPSAREAPWQYLVVLLLAVGVAWTTVDIPKRFLKAVVACGVLLNLFSLAWVASRFGIGASPFPGAAATLLSFAIGMSYATSEAGRRKQVLKQVFGERVSPAAFRALLDARHPPPLEGEAREVSVLVCEVFNNDDLMAALPTTDYVQMTNLFLKVASDFVVERGGYLDESDGESLRAIFGAPLADERHAATACETAIDLSRRLDNLNLECESRWHKTLDHRVGVNSGEMVVGAFGSQRLGNFTASGEAVEFARRLCVANTLYGSRILIGSTTYLRAGSAIEVRPLDLVQGRDERTREEVYELLDRKDALGADQLARRDLFWKAVIYFREQRWDDALDHFQAALSGNGSDAPVEFYLRRLQRMRSGREQAGGWTPLHL